MEAVDATGAAVVLEDGNIAWPEGQPGAHAVRLPLRWKRGKNVRAQLDSVPLAGSRATALALVFSELFQNALEHGGNAVEIELDRRNGEVLLTIADDGSGIDSDASGTGLSIVRALVRDELQGQLNLRNTGGTRAEVVFPAGP